MIKKILLLVVIIAFFLIVFFTTCYFGPLLLHFNKYMLMLTIFAMVGIMCFFIKTTGLIDEESAEKTKTQDAATAGMSKIAYVIIVISSWAASFLISYFFYDYLKLERSIARLASVLSALALFSIVYCILKATGRSDAKPGEKAVDLDPWKLHMDNSQYWFIPVVFLLIFILLIFLPTYFPSLSAYFARFASIGR